MVTEVASIFCEHSDTDICSDRHLSDLEYEDDTKLLCVDASKLQVSVSRVKNIAVIIGMHCDL